MKNFNYLIALYLSINGYEMFLKYTYHISFPISITKFLIIGYSIYLLLFIYKKRIKIKINFTESIFYIILFIFFIFSFWNIEEGFKYSLSMLMVFTLIFLLKQVKKYLDLNKIIDYSVYMTIPLIVLNFIFSFNNNYFSWKHQFFGAFGNANIFGMWVIFILASIYLFKGNKNLRGVLFFVVLYMIIISLGRANILTAFLILFLYFRNNLKIIFTSSLFVIALLTYFSQELPLITYIVNRFSEVNSRAYSDMFLPVINNDFLPHGTYSFSDYMWSIGETPDSSYFALLYDIGFLVVLYIIPFLYIMIKSNFEMKVLIFALLFQSLFEKIFVSPVNSYFIFILMIMIIFPHLFVKPKRRIFYNEKNINIHR